jgi:3-oxoacyl-[acyl-carrier-protein] synthase-3
MRARLVSTGSYLPDTVVTNESLTQFPPHTLPLIEAKTGVRERRHAAEGQCTSDLGREAARQCLERAGVEGAALDAVILTTSSPDRIQPATATRVQEAIGARGAFAFDLNSVCAGGVYALHVADAMIRAGTSRTVLVVASEVYSRYLNPKDFSTFPYFGDGAAAVLLRAAEETEPGGIVGSLLGSDGSRDHVIQIPAGGTMLPYGKLSRPSDVYFKMRGREVYEFAVTQGSAVVRQLLQRHGIGKDEVAFVVPHQANVNVVNELAERLEVERDRFIVNLDRYGNTAGASVLIGLDELCQSGRLRSGDHIILVAFGGGLSWGATLIRN